MQLSFRNRPSKNDRNLKKPAAPAPHAPATVLFPGFAVPAKAVCLPFRNTDKFKDLNKKSRLSRAGPAHLLGPAYPLDLLSRFRPLPRTDSQRCESGRDCYSLPKKDEFKIKKPAATYFPAFAVSSAQRCLTSVFGMGTGIATSPWPPAFITMPLL